MTIEQYLLACLAEECAEIIQSVNKALRFGLDNHHPDREETNLQEITKELQDLLGVAELLTEHGVDLSNIADRNSIDNKKEKVMKYIDYSRKRGTLQ